MSVESAIAYITRMREDKEFHSSINQASEDESAAWELIRAHGYDFTHEEFNEAKNEIYSEFGIAPV
jgi:predicted ribosomally synthesized peptide with nif11-like leader